MVGEKWCVTATRAAASPGGSSQEALCTAPATRKGSRGLAAATRAAAPPQEALRTAPATRKAAAGQRRPHAPQLFQEDACDAAPPGSSVYCVCHTKGSQEALCTAPATRKGLPHERQPRARRLSVLRLPHAWCDG